MLQQDKAKKIGPVEALVLVLICLFALAVVLPATQMSRFEAYRIECGNNLSQIGRAMFIYADDYDDELPRSGSESTDWAPTIPNWKADNRFVAYGLLPDGSGGMASISSCFYLLVKYAEVMPGTFVCPGDAGTTEFNPDFTGSDRDLIDLWDFGPEARVRCSYAYQTPFGYYALTTSSEPGHAVAADRNPWMDSPAAFAKQHPGFFNPNGSRESVKYGNARAHEEDGQNVLFIDGHVAFEDRSFCSIRDDNIYTFWDGGDMRIGSPPIIGSESQHPIDSLLVHDPVTPIGTTIIKDPIAGESTDLEQTSFVATLDCPMPKFQNVIWCSTFQIGWDKLKNDIIGGSVEVPGAQELADNLNQAEFSTENIEDESYYATAGLLEDGIIGQIQQEMTQQFPYEPEPIINGIDELPPETIIVYSYLNADIEFEYPFYINNAGFEFQDSNGTISEVTSFCVPSDADGLDLVRRQVDVLYYKFDYLTGETEFVIDLCIYTHSYQVVLACVPQKETLSESLAFVEQKISEFKQNPDYKQLRYLKPVYRFYPGAQRPADSLIVPDLLYKLTHRFEELDGKAIEKQPRRRQYFIGKALQTINLLLGRTGMVLESDAQVVMPPLKLPPEIRYFHFDRPFLIYLKKRGPDYSPFFVMWVDNAELMQEFVFQN